MRIFVLGGTGAIGQPTVTALRHAGHDVRALARSEDSASKLRAAGAAPVEVSMLDRRELAREFADHDAVINLATAQPSTFSFVFMRAWRQQSASAPWDRPQLWTRRWTLKFRC